MGKKVYAVLKYFNTLTITNEDGTDESVPVEGVVGYIPVFATREEAEANQLGSDGELSDIIELIINTTP